MTQIPTWTQLSYEHIPDLPTLERYISHFAEQAGSVEACIDLGGTRYSYGVFYERVGALAKGLKSIGVKPGDCVATLSPPHTQAWISFLATAWVGGIWVGLNPKYTRQELRYVLSDAAPKVILTAASIDGRAYKDDLQATAPSDAQDHIYVFGGAQDGLPSVEGLFEHGCDTDPVAEPDNPCLLVYTSGTTGKPKGALLKQSGLIACSRVQAHHYGMLGSRGLNPLPINHVGSICDTGTTLLVSGGTQVFVSTFDPEKINAAYGEEKITTWGGIPTMFQLQMMHPSFAAFDASTVKRILWSGAPMPMELAQTLASYGLPMHNFYGMTETTGSICFTAANAQLEHLVDTVGTPEETYEVRIAEPETGQDCAEGDVGEIQVRAPGVFHSYLNRPDDTAAAFTPDGWFKTGDLASRDAAGDLRLSGRLKEMFKSGGYNVYPSEVEAALEAMPDILQAVVVSVSDPLFHEVGYAFIVSSNPADYCETTLKADLAKTLANYKIPKHFKRMDHLPMLPVGKVDRQSLKSLAKAEAA